MAREIKIKCCDGNEEYEGQCLKSKCPWYVKARQMVDVRWSRVPTGFGNLYGEPQHNDFLSQVRTDIKHEEKSRLIKPEDRNII